MKPFIIKSETAPATAKLVTRLAEALLKTDNLLSRVCGYFGKCEPGGCPLYPTQDELDNEEYLRGCIWCGLNDEFSVSVMDAYRDWIDLQRKQDIWCDDMENAFEEISSLEDEK